MKYLLPRLYENEPQSENSERALRALSGQLWSNPPHVIDAFDLGVDESAWIVDVAISPTGKMAILAGEHQDPDKSSKVLLTTWPRPSGYSEFKSLGIVKDDADVRVLFPAGSKNPAVIVGGEKIVWGDWTLELPWKEELAVPEEAYLTLWSTDDDQRIAYICDGKVHAKMRHHVTHLNAGPPSDFVSSGSVARWLGLVNGSPAWIVNEDPDGKCETLHWRNVEAIMMRGERIIPESIGFVDGGLQFVTGDLGRLFAHRVKINDQKNELISDPMEVCLWGDDRIFGYNKSSPALYEFTTRAEWVQIAEMGKRQLAIQEGADVYGFGDHIVFVDEQTLRQDRIIDVIPNGPIMTTMVIGGPKTGYRRAHDGLMYQTIVMGNGRFIWCTFDGVTGKRPLTATFPLYSQIDSLTPIEDERGKAIMSWGYAEGTFHVVRYPLPTR